MQTISVESFNDRITTLRMSELTARDEIVSHLRDADDKNRWSAAGFKSLKDYCQRELGYSPFEIREILVRLGHIVTRDRMTSSDPKVHARILELLTWRRTKSLEDRIPAFRVMTNKTLMKLAERPPANLVEMRAVSGMGPVKVEMYGEALLAMLT